MGSLEGVWNHLKLSEAEVETSFVASDGDAWQAERPAFCRVGKPLTPKAFNSPAMEATLTQIRQLGGGLEVRDLGSVMVLDGVQLQNRPALCFFRGTRDHQLEARSDEAAGFLSKKGLLRESKFAWLEIWKMHTIHVAKHGEIQRYESGGPYVGLEKMGIENMESTPTNVVCRNNSKVMPIDGPTDNNPFVSLTNTLPINLLAQYTNGFFESGCPTPIIAEQPNKSGSSAHNRRKTARTCQDDSSINTPGFDAISTGVQMEVAQSNTPTAHALRAWAWSSGRGFGLGLGRSRRWITCLWLSISHRYSLSVVSLDVVCFDVTRWISVWLLESDESDRDLPPQCFSESIDPSVDGCTSKQRSLRGGWTETLDANGEILSYWGKVDYLIFLVLQLYFDIFCNRFLCLI